MRLIKNAIGAAIVIILLVIAIRIYDGSNATVKIADVAEISIEQDTKSSPDNEQIDKEDKNTSESILNENEVQVLNTTENKPLKKIPLACLADDPPLTCITGEYSD